MSKPDNAPAQGKQSDARLLVWGVIAWLVLTLLFFLFPSLLTCGQRWIEIINGATWPTDWKTTIYADCEFCFAASVAARTLINFAGPLVILVAVLNFGRAMENRMKLTLTEYLRVHDTELLATIFSAIETLKPGMLSAENRAFIRERARSVGAKLGEDLTVGGQDSTGAPLPK